MNIRAKYKENELLIAGYRSYLQNRLPDATVKKTSWMVKECDQADEDLLIEEMARLLEQNRDIRNKAIVNAEYLDQVFEDDKQIISANFKELIIHV